MKELLAQIEAQYQDELALLNRLRAQVQQQEVKVVKIEGAIEFGRQVVERENTPTPLHLPEQPVDATGIKEAV